MALFVAWHTASFERTQKLEPLESIYKKIDRKKSMPTSDQVLEKAKALTIALGGSITEKEN